MKTTNKSNASLLIAVAAAAILAGGAGFYGGVKYQEGRRGNLFRQFGNGQMGAPHGGQISAGRGGFRPVSGEIIKSDETTITVKLPDGGSRIVFIGEKTAINTASEATRTDLKTGTTVAVFGTENADGTVTAQTVQLNPQLRMGGLRGASPSAAPKP